MVPVPKLSLAILLVRFRPLLYFVLFFFLIQIFLISKTVIFGEA